ncbi:ATP-binding protein [Geobacter sp. FeAm09]|uniref:AAA family ATPase n=1 Tax=Geobacter sp. FeAm09 TaxID=2597769 RepID=UPI0011EE4BF2|nr:AAA family ATPase [Geobacter sp. FeAm09]QEM68234.1 ATP-binding protein [Geobacter sp. FeAm09]
MSLVKLSYSEFESEPKIWKISDATFSGINLIAGKNSAGKSRLLSVINSLSHLLTGKVQRLFESGKFDVTINLAGGEFNYKIEIKDSSVINESLIVNNIELLMRNEDGTGKIYYETKTDFLEFKLPPDAIAAVNRRDEIQHPFLIELHKWANSIAYYQFGSDFGKSFLMRVDIAENIFDSKNPSYLDDPNNLVRIYATAFNSFGEEFDQAIISDMRNLGYALTEVGCTDIQQMIKIPLSALGMFTTEEELGFMNPQLNMSQGMFRALALVIHLNVCAFSKSKNLILVDDIGEGLDYERATAIIDLLIYKAINNDMQIIMTSNDRFVMNKIPLEYWSVLKRTGGIVKMFNIRNSEKQFNRFKYMGMNNFDFFASNFFEQEVPND